MRFVTITGGLGNQMFEYAFYLSLRAKGQEVILFVPRNKDSKGYGHQGYELERLFGIERLDGWKTKIQRGCLKYYSNFIRLFPARYKALLFRFVGVHVLKVPENFIFYPSVFDFNHKHELFMGIWHSELFFEHASSEVRNEFEFNNDLLSLKTKQLATDINNTTSVSIHIRRGDYLSDKYSNGFAGVCTDEYYSNAIKFIRERIESPIFYIFTDDQKWVREHFKPENAVYVNHNSGKDSWQDMYLMSQCKHNIIANSSFSWWGAWLNANPDKIVIAPKVWWRMLEHDDVVPRSWIRL